MGRLLWSCRHCRCALIPTNPVGSITYNDTPTSHRADEGPYPNGNFDGKPSDLGPKAGRKLGCIDQTPIPDEQSFRGGDVFLAGGGYPDPPQFLIGYMIYDGPVRMFDNRFVNFNVAIAPRLTCPDKTFLQEYYPCPPQGCITYKVTLAASTYTPAPSMCDPYQGDKYRQAPPVPLYRLAYTEKVNGLNPPVVPPAGGMGGQGDDFPHYASGTLPVCR